MDVNDLAGWLKECEPEMIVRLTASWIDKAVSTGMTADAEPALDGRPHIDALIAAAVEYAADRRGDPRPDWTTGPGRSLTSFWHPGVDGMFAHSLVHAPAVFAVRGVLIGEDSLQCV